MNDNKYILDCDFHTHTGFSDDCYVSVDEMLEGAAAQGIKTLAVTDHYDPGYPDPEFPFTIDFDDYQKQCWKTEKNTAASWISDRTGSRNHGRPVRCRRSGDNAFPYDVILGSFHCLRSIDLYTFDFTDVDGPAMLEDFYTYMYDCLKVFHNYDVVGHFSILDRYIGKLYDYAPFGDIIDETLKLLIQGGKVLKSILQASNTVPGHGCPESLSSEDTGAGR